MLIFWLLFHDSMVNYPCILNLMEGNSSMSKKKGDGLKSFNKGFQVPDTYIMMLYHKS